MRVEFADDEVADGRIDARVVHVDDRARRMGVYVVEDVLGGAAMGQHRALAGPCQVLRQRERAEMPPGGGGDLVAYDGADELAHAQRLDAGSIVSDHVVVSGGQQVDAVSDEFDHPVGQGHDGIRRGRGVYVKIGRIPAARVDHVVQLGDQISAFRCDFELAHHRHVPLQAAADVDVVASRWHPHGTVARG